MSPHTRVHPDPDTTRPGRLGYLCAVCGTEEICPRFGLPASGFQLTALSRVDTDRLVWLCSPVCLRAYADTL